MVELGEVEGPSELGEAVEVDEAEEVEELEGAEEPVEEAIEVEEAEELGDAEETADELDEAEEGPEAGAEETVEVEEVEELDEQSDEAEEGRGRAGEPKRPAEEVGEPVEVEEVEELDEPGELDEAEEAPEAEAEEAPEAEAEDEAEELDELDEAEELDELDEAEELDELDEAEELDELDEAEELDELDEAEELDELDEAEELDELDEAEELDELDAVEPEEDGGEPESPEELPPVSAGATTFGRGFFSFGRGIEVRLSEPVQQPDEELEAVGVDEAEPARSGAQESGAHESGGQIRFTDAREGVYPDYEIATVSEILDRLHIDRQILRESEGVVEIGREVYADLGSPRDEDTRDLVDSIIGRDASDEESGIETLFGGGSDDLLPEFSRSERVERKEVEASLFRFVEQGFDYDAFLRGFQDTDSGVLKSMVRFTRLWNARVGTLLTESEDGLEPGFQLGLEPQCAASLGISRSSGLYRNILSPRNILLLRQPIVNVEYFSGLCKAESLALFERSLFLPIVFRGKPAYALLGLPRSMDSIEAVFRTVLPQLSSRQGALR